MRSTMWQANSVIGRLLAVITVSVGVAFVSGCANLNTIDRTNTLVDKPKTIHLDVQQRLLIVNEAGKYCAEPSPDALAAYAAALGLGISAPAKGAISVSGGGQGSAASIGLRTQSITLMRDALYRMCEAYANGGIGDAQVVTLLNRSQDLTAVILAVEQLTGAVAANQASLTGSSSSNSFATALNSSKLFSEASAHEARALKRLEESKAELASASEKHRNAEAAVVRSDAALSTLEDAETPDKEKVALARGEVAYRRSMRDSAAASLKAIEARVDLHQRNYDNAQSVAAEIAKTPDASSSSSAAGTTGGSEYSAPSPRVALSSEATVALSSAVKEIVVKVLEKDYVVDGCMSVITSNKLSEVAQIRELESESRVYCQSLINALVREKAVLAETRIELAKRNMISMVTDDAAKIMGCIAPQGRLVPAKRDQLFADANVSGALSDSQSVVKIPTDANGFKTMLSLYHHIRAAMAAVVGSSVACK